MPYTIEALDTGWVVRGDDGDLVAEHPTKAQALAHMRALYANVSDAKQASELERISDADAERFWAFVKKSDECWEWTGYRTEKGYGQFRLNGISEKAHRVAWAIEHGSNSTEQLRHKCNNTSCVRPSHLQPGTNDENVRDRYGTKQFTASEFDDELEGWDELPLDWTEVRLLRFADYFGYKIEPNSESVLGYSVTNAQGQRLGGFVARNIVEGYLKNPEGKATTAAGKKKKSGGSAKKDVAAIAATKRQDATAAANDALDLVLPDVLEARSKGKIDADAIEQLKQQARAAISGATDAASVREALKDFKKQLSIYKQEATKPPPADQQLRDTVSKTLDALPNSAVLAGRKYDEKRIQSVLDAGRERLLNAKSPADVAVVTRQIRLDVSLEKLAQDKELAATKEAAKKASTDKRQTRSGRDLPPRLGQLSQSAIRSASEAARSDALPRTASEWAEYYTQLYFDEEPWAFMAPGQPRDAEGKWTTGGGGYTGLSASQAQMKAVDAKIRGQWGSEMDAKLEQKIVDSMADYIAASDVAINLPESILSSVLTDGFKNQHQTGKSFGGQEDKKFRREVEQDMFGLKRGAKPTDYPIYGYLDHKTDRTPSKNASVYGGAKVTLKSGVRERSSFTVGDSLFAAGLGTKLPSPLNKPSLVSFGGPGLNRDMSAQGAYVAALRGKGSMVQARSRFSYYEVQIHGGVKAADISHVTFPKQPTAAIAAQLTSAGIPWSVQK